MRPLSVVVIVGVEPAGVFGIAGVEPGIGPFVGQGAPAIIRPHTDIGTEDSLNTLGHRAVTGDLKVSQLEGAGP